MREIWDLRRLHEKALIPQRFQGQSAIILGWSRYSVALAADLPLPAARLQIV
jgi:hypothetical protein